MLITWSILIFYAAVLGALVYLSRLPGYVPLAMLLLSIISYFVYKNDKSAAERKLWRTPESSLHFLSLLGGWPGALVAQVRLRHKSSKTGFKIIFYRTVFLNVLIIIVLSLQQDGKLRHSLGIRLTDMGLISF